MNIIAKALDEIKFRIPPQVLKVAMRDSSYNWRAAPVSIDEIILSRVIKPRVLIDCNLVGGTTIVVSLEGLEPRYSDVYSVVYQVPPERINFREIVSILSVSYMPQSLAYNGAGYGTGVMTSHHNSEVGAVAQRIADSVSNIPVISNASADLIGPNTVLVRDGQRVSSAYQLRCVVGNEENLNNINPRSYLAFSKLCELAVKAYIYNNLIVRIDQAYLEGGQELGSLKNYVESLSDAEENYQTYLQEVMRTVMFVNDSKGYERFIKVQLCPAV